MERNPMIDATEKSNDGGAIAVEAAVLQRYGSAAREVEACLCLPVSYDQALLKVIPDEIITKDYGCGDPSRYIREGETVLDLGSGSGKACYIIAQIVGARGNVIGVDFNPPMLELARKYQRLIGEKLGYDNVEFRRGKIQDLKTNVELLDLHLKENPVRSVADLARLEEFESRMRQEQPLIADESVDVIVSNCVLNLVRPEDKKRLFAEMYRVLRRGGRHRDRFGCLPSSCPTAEEFLIPDSPSHGTRLERVPVHAKAAAIPLRGART